MPATHRAAFRALLTSGLTLLLLCSCGSNPTPASQTPGPAPTALATPEAPTANLKQVTTGPWGGRGIRLEVIAGPSSAIDFDCAVGSLTDPLLLSESNQFAANGNYTPEFGVIHEGQVSRTYPALYAGEVFGDVMNLTVTFTPTDDSGTALPSISQTYRLHYRATLRLTKCL